MIFGFSCNTSRDRRWTHVAWLSVFCAALPLVECLPAYAAGPSFDCSKASQPDERIICGSEELSALELKASREFAYVRDNVDAERARQTARAVLGERRNCGAKTDCIKGVLSRAIQNYETLGAPNNSLVAAPAQLSPGSYSVLPNVSDGILNIRSGPGAGHSIVVAIPAGSGGVTIGSCQAADDSRSRYSWCKAQWKNYSGWVSSGWIVADAGVTASPSVTPAPTQPPNSAMIAGNTGASFVHAPGPGEQSPFVLTEGGHKTFMPELITQFVCIYISETMESHSQFLDDNTLTPNSEEWLVFVDWNRHMVGFRYRAKIDGDTVEWSDGKSFYQKDGTWAPATHTYSLDRSAGTIEHSSYDELATHIYSGTCRESE
jgi:uncharacterized protein YraI